MAKRSAGGGVHLDLIGDRELQRKFRALPGKVQKKFARKSMRKAAKVIQREAKRLVPVESGDLRKNIKVRSAKRSRSRIGIDVIVGDGWYAGEQFYGAFLEFGTSRMRARPYMRPALDAKRKEARGVLVDELQSLIAAEGAKA